MKRKTLFIISLIYSIVLFVAGIGNFIIGAALGAGESFAIGLMVIILAILMLVGSIGVKNSKGYGKVLLIITGLLCIPLGLIVAIPAMGKIED